MIITIGSEVKDNKGNHYVLDEVIGSGGFGIVYKAHCKEDGSVVAIKMLQNSFSSQDAFLTFQKEANQASLFESENVIRYLYIHDGTQFPDFPPYIIMEYTADGTLRDVMEQRHGKQFDIKALISIYLQLAYGMKCVSARLVHRDIKPENILNFGGVFKITDFGLSKISGESTKTLTFKNGGTSLYIAPEAWSNDRNTIQMDIYSMGIVFYELATLSYPYQIPMQGDFLAIRDMHLYTPPKNPSSINRLLPANIVSIILRMIEKPTQKRFSNWDEIITALSAESLPQDGLSGIVEMALSKRNQKDIQRQTEQAEKKKADAQREQHIKMTYAQYISEVLQPIRDFAERFNSQYARPNAIKTEETAPSLYSPRFSSKIHTPANNDVTITGEIIFEEQFTRKQISQFDYSQRIIHYIPQCRGKDVLLWCQVADTKSLGFNIVLLRNESSLYGDWFILENTSNGLGRIDRPGPFGFSLTELPKEINYIGSLHIYNMELYPFTQEKLLRFITERV